MVIMTLSGRLLGIAINPINARVLVTNNTNAPVQLTNWGYNQLVHIKPGTMTAFPPAHATDEFYTIQPMDDLCITIERSGGCAKQEYGYSWYSETLYGFDVKQSNDHSTLHVGLDLILNVRRKGINNPAPIVKRRKWNDQGWRAQSYTTKLPCEGPQTNLNYYFQAHLAVLSEGTAESQSELVAYIYLNTATMGATQTFGGRVAAIRCHIDINQM